MSDSYTKYYDDLADFNIISNLLGIKDEFSYDLLNKMKKDNRIEYKNFMYVLKNNKG